MSWIFLFVVTVWKMRFAQMAYFKGGRKQSDLQDAKKYERMVDAELVKRLVLSNGVPTGLTGDETLFQFDNETQANLFDGE